MAAPPPPFDTTGVNIDDNRQLGLQVAAWFCTGTAACTVAMKLFTKARIVKMVGWDDFIILLSLVSGPEPAGRGLRKGGPPPRVGGKSLTWRNRR